MTAAPHDHNLDPPPPLEAGDVYELGDVILLTLDRGVKDAVMAKLDQFIFSEDVQLGDVTDTFAQVAVVGPQAVALVSSVTGVFADGCDLAVSLVANAFMTGAPLRQNILAQAFHIWITPVTQTAPAVGSADLVPSPAKASATSTMIKCSLGRR